MKETTVTRVVVRYEGEMNEHAAMVLASAAMAIGKALESNKNEIQQNMEQLRYDIERAQRQLR